MDRHYSSLFELLERDRLGDDIAWESRSWPDLETQGTAASPSTQQWFQAESQWWGAVAALSDLLRSQLSADLSAAKGAIASAQAVLLSGPLPVLQAVDLREQLSSWLFMPQSLADMLAVARPLLPFRGTSGDCQQELLQTIPLASDQDLGQERFCLVVTDRFSLSLVLSGMAAHPPRLRFSFDPTVNQQVWQRLRSQVAHSRPPLLSRFDAVARGLAWIDPHYRLVSQFSHQLLQHMQEHSSAMNRSVPKETPGSTYRLSAGNPLSDTFSRSVRPPYRATHAVESPSSPSGDPPPCRDAQLLQAMAHEIRTPLTTIRTFTRSLLKRRDLSADVVRRLTLIDRECTQQIDRFNLIFQAVELETGSKQPRSPLAPISVNQIFQQAIPSWQQQVQRRGLNLEVNLPAQLPTVTSDPAMLQQVLTGLIERFTQSLPPNSHINLTVTPAGHQLKLQFQSRSTADPPTAMANPTPLQSLGQLLMFQPETGGLSLNLHATKNLFHALGGKLTVRQKPQSGEVLTVFLPLETRTV